MKKILQLTLIACLVFVVFDCKKETPLPVAGFSSYIYTSIMGRVDFTNLSSNAVAFAWDFGDGTISQLTNPYHIYTQNGSYTVTLVANGDGGSSSVSQTVIITNILVPIADFSFYISSTTPGLVDFTNTSSYANSYSWDFGDGTTSTDVNPSHIYLQNGNYTVTLEATGDGGSNSTSNSFDITNVPTEICVWTALSVFPCSTEVIDVYIDDVYAGSLDQYYTTTPDCGESGTVTLPVTPGTHKFAASCASGSTTWGPDYYNVDDGVCYKWELSSKGKSFTSSTSKKTIISTSKRAISKHAIQGLPTK